MALSTVAPNLHQPNHDEDNRRSHHHVERELQVLECNSIILNVAPDARTWPSGDSAGAPPSCLLLAHAHVKNLEVRFKNASVPLVQTDRIVLQPKLNLSGAMMIFSRYA